MNTSSLKLCQALMLAGVMTAAVAAPATGKRTYIVQLAGAPAASYNGGVAGLAATQAPDGQRLNARQAAVQAYRAHLGQERQAVLNTLGTSVKVLHRYDLAFNGFAAVLTPAQVRKLQASGKVLAVTPDEMREVETISTPHFLGLDGEGGVWSRLVRGKQDKGEGVVVAVLDTGVQPENPSFFDQVDATGTPVKTGGTVVYGAPPAGWAGSCTSGPGFPATSCNNKLIGAKVFSAGFLDAVAQGAVNPFFGNFYDVPRDEDGHGSHTLSTAAGNANTPAYASNGALVGAMSGIAPRARVATYKVCFDRYLADGTLSGSCFASDSIAAVEAAVADGVDVINFSIGGSQTNLLDPVEMAFFNATAAGVFVSASAGNSGPANAVAHNSPWLTTVAASTHDRQMVADLTQGDASTYTGASFNATALPSASMVLSSAIPAPGATVADANLCFLNSLDSEAARGKIVVCDRGTNARVDKSAEVKRVGGVGMVLINPSANNLVADFHSVPTVHLQSDVRSAVRAYVTAGSATGAIGASHQQPGAVAPVMASFSSRGPNLADPSVMKPDITAPGVDIIAGYAYKQASLAEHDAILAGTLVPPGVAESLQGTSMSSPHVAGEAALIKQAHPGWSPSMIKSAMMTSAGGVKNADGSADTNRYGFGAGHLNPLGAADPGLVYTAGPAAYLRFLCGGGWLASTDDNCTTYGSITPTDLNLPSVAVDVPGSVTVRRHVRNVGPAGTYTATATVPGFDVTFSPPTLTLATGESGQFQVTLKTNGAPIGSRVFGSLSWQDGVHVVTSPVQARAANLAAPTLLTSTQASATQKFKVSYGFTGATSTVVAGLKAATRSAGTVATNASTCFDLVVPADALLVRAALYDAETSGGGLDDLDLALYSPTNVLVASSGGATANELVSLRAPAAAGTYKACVLGYAPNGGSSNFTLSSWVLSAADAGGSLTAKGLPTSVTAGDTRNVTVQWSGLADGVRYMGGLRYAFSNGTAAGITLLSVEPNAPTLTQRDAEITPRKLRAQQAR